MFDGHESKAVGHENRHRCSSLASAASAIAALRQDREGPRQPMGMVLVTRTELVRQRVCGQAASACSQRSATAPPVPTGVPESLVLLPGWAGAVCRMAGMHSAGALLLCNDF